MNFLFSSSLSFKLLLCLLIPVTLDEYYYFLWGQHLSLSYFDHPPMVGWIMSLASPFKNYGEGAVRWPFAILSHLTIFIWYKILIKEVKPRALYWFVVTALLNPLWGMGGLIATPDIPLMFFWSLSIFFTQKLLDSNNIKYYLLLGISLGFGFVSKYQIVLFIPALAWLFYQQKLWARLLSWKTIPAIIIGLIFCSPVIGWNAANDWASFAFQWKHGMAAKHWSWSYPPVYLLSEVLLILPPFLIFFFQKDKSWKKHWLLPFALFPFAFFLYSSFKGRVEANWPIMAFPPMYALAFIYMSSYSEKWIKRSNRLWAGLLCLILILIPLKDSFPSKKIKIFEADKFSTILNYVRNNSDQTYLTYSYQLSGFLSFKQNKLICKFPKYGRIDHFNYLTACKELPDNFILISEERWGAQHTKDFPLYDVVNQVPIKPNFFAIKVYKR